MIWEANGTLMPTALLSCVGVGSMLHSLHSANLRSRAEVSVARNAISARIGDNARMEKLWENQIKALRNAAGLSLEELGALVEPPISKGMMSQYERGKRRPRQDTLNAIAAALGTTPGAVIDGEPAERVPAEVVDLWQRIAEADKPRVKDILRTFAQDSDDAAAG